MEKRTKEEIMEKFYALADKLDISPEELAGVPWPLLEQMLFPRIWTEEDFEEEASEIKESDADETFYVFESGHMRVVEENRAEELYNRVINGKKQGKYTVQNYYNLPDNIRAELIDGVLYFKGSPSYLHQLVLVEIITMLHNFIRKNKGGCHVLAAPLDVQIDCDEDSMLQPDIMVSCRKERREEWGIYGAPDMVVEITSPSTRTLDTKKKLEKYRSAGVREYWIVDFQKRIILTYFFERDINPHFYNFDSNIPVAIFEDKCIVSFEASAEELKAAFREVKEENV